MDTTKPTEESQKSENTQAETEQTTPSVRPEYSGDKGEYEINLVRNNPVEHKTVATFSFGKRVRIAALATPQYEQMLDHIIQVAGWARTTRMGGKDFCFIELTDGSGATTL